MKNKWLITVLLLSTLVVLSVSSAWAIVHGRIADPSQYPWMVFVQRKEDGLIGSCGGTLVAPNWVLTAAHCTPLTEDGQMLVGVGGDLDLERGVSRDKVFEVTKWVVHPSYQFIGNKIDNDIALLKLDRSSSNQTISIPAPLDALYSAGNVGKIAGWGAMETGDPSPVLREANVVIFPQGHCAIWLPLSVLTNNMFCVRSYGAPHEAASRGDSGGPMIVNQSGTVVQIGVTSWASPLTPFNTYQPAVYVRAANYHDWIYGVINTQ